MCVVCVYGRAGGECRDGTALGVCGGLLLFISYTMYNVQRLAVSVYCVAVCVVCVWMCLSACSVCVSVCVACYFLLDTACKMCSVRQCV